MKEMKVRSIGGIEIANGAMDVVLDKPYIPALGGLEGFSHVVILWWFDKLDTAQARQTLVTPVPYRTRPGDIGVFATRSPRRPNPLALTVAEVLHIDYDAGRIRVGYVDAEPGSPVLDLKPYSPCIDRVDNPAVPEWCAHWPRSLEESADFDWEGEFSRRM